MFINIVIVASLMTGAQAVDQTGPQQQRAGTDRAVQYSDPVRAMRIDTSRFFPQIDKSLNFRPITIEHFEREPKSAGGTAVTFTSGITDRPGPLPELNFPGLSYDDYVPGDPDIAVGPSHLVQVVNSEIGFFDKSTGAMLFRHHAFTFFSSVRQTSILIDPKVIYDPLAERFVILFHENNLSTISNFLFAVSDDSDPNGIWHLYRFDTMFNIGGIDHWTDFASLGGGPDGYVISANVWSVTHSFRGSVFVTIPKQEVLSGQPVTATAMHETGTYSLRVGITDDPSVHEVFGATRSSGSSIKLYAFSDTGTSSPSYVTRNMSVESVQFPPAVVSSGSSGALETLSYTLMKAAWRNGRLFVSSSFLSSSNMAGTYWAEFDLRDWPTSGNPSLAQQGIVSSPSTNYFMSSIGANKHGDVSLIFTGSNTSIVSDLYVVARTSSDPLGTVSSPVFFGGATGSIYPTSQWGDYFDVDIDPVDGETFWGTGMVVNALNGWDTHIVSWKVSSTSFLAPSSHSWLRGQHVAGDNASLVFNDDDYNSARAGLTLFPSESPAQLRAESTAPSGQVLDIEINVAAMVSTSGLTQDIHAWNFISSEWVLIDSQIATTSESIQTVVVSGALSEFLEAGTRKVRAKVQWRQTGLTLNWPWTVSIDQFEWEIRVR